MGTRLARVARAEALLAAKVLEINRSLRSGTRPETAIARRFPLPARSAIIAALQPADFSA